MNRAELKTIAEGFKAVRPPKMVAGYTNTIPVGAAVQVDNQMFYTEVENFAYTQWRTDVCSIADKLLLDPKARSNFLAASGLIHNDQG